MEEYINPMIMINAKKGEIKPLMAKVEGRPDIFHFKEDGTTEDGPSLAIEIYIPPGKIAVMGQFSLKCLRLCLEEVGYTIVEKK